MVHSRITPGWRPVAVKAAERHTPLASWIAPVRPADRIALRAPGQIFAMAEDYDHLTGA